MYDELLALEDETGYIRDDSPSVNVGFETAAGLPKIVHEIKMLSLNKTKDRDELKAWLGDKKGLLSWKLDGLTVGITYENGRLVQGVTRGNGIEGELITANVLACRNVPKSIPYKGKTVLRGEAVIKYSDFEKINEAIEDTDAKYKNPRNLCSGSIRQLDPKVTAERYAATLGETAKFPKDSIAFKWRDQQAETVLREIEWSPSRTGLLNPVAIFDPVELEGTTVSRASVHNINIMEDLELGIGDTIQVYKANMIIPQLAGTSQEAAILRFRPYARYAEDRP